MPGWVYLSSGEDNGADRCCGETDKRTEHKEKGLMGWRVEVDEGGDTGFLWRAQQGASTSYIWTAKRERGGGRKPFFKESGSVALLPLTFSPRAQAQRSGENGRTLTSSFPSSPSPVLSRSLPQEALELLTAEEEEEEEGGGLERGHSPDTTAPPVRDVQQAISHSRHSTSVSGELVRHK
ncbi:hypothetical protein EYF80_047437 [Liparis tanakae]|uniref:Uncharacterized protein n=1 Tax=Liparis tanakae TaxID=230148 RepID=A0A4Z2FMD5_9TELE|nr:hypothetical protein EYF80_047437 [Liparis tanakae]